MTKVIQIAITTLWVLIGLLITVGEANACSCAETSIEARFENADYVFTATIIGGRLEGLARTTIEEKKRDKVSYSSMDKIQVEFDPLKNYKGSSSELEFLYTHRGSESCGFEVVVGSIQTFFVKKGKIVGKCSGVLRDKDAHEFYDYVTKMGLE